MKTRLLVILLSLSLSLFSQHNSSYTQYMFNGLLLNPAYAGSNDALNLTALYRKQWLGLDGSPTTITFSAHSPLKNEKVALGVVVMDDKFGVSDHTKMDLIYAYRVKLGKGKLSFGLQGGVDSYKTNWDQVRTTQLRDPSFTINSVRNIQAQAGFGLYYYSQNMYIGASIPSILNNNQMKYQTAVATAGCVLSISDVIKIKPAVLVRYILDSPLDVNVTTTFYWRNVLGLGLGYSINSTAMSFLDLKVNDQFRIGYAYDYTLSTLRNYNTGSHEIMLRYLFNYRVNVSSTRYF